MAVSLLSMDSALLMSRTIAKTIDQKSTLLAIREDDDTRAKVRLLKLCLSVSYGTRC
jgi:hypothetical protein